VLPAANAYEKSGTFTNTCGDLQLVKKAGEVTGTKSDFEMIVRIAGAMGFDVRRLVPFGRGVGTDMGQSRGAQSGEADRHAVSVQLAAYRLAWAALAGVPVAAVRAAFHYVGHDETVRPADLLDEAGLAALIEQIPVGE